MDDLIRDIFNPKFVHYSRIEATELGAARTLPKDRLAAHIDEAIFAWCTAQADACDCRADAASTLRDLHVELMEPICGEQNVRVDLWVSELDQTSCSYGFLCSSDDGTVPYARGERTIVKIDPSSKRPCAWSAPFRTHQAELLKDLPAYA